MADTTDNNTTDTTVFHDRINYNVKHPLQNTWTLWFDNPKKKANNASWSQNLKAVTSIDAVEDFWGVYNNLVMVDRLDDNSNYHLFKKGIRPEWEDPVNANGGKFSIKFVRGRNVDTINNFWLHMIMALIGEQFDHGDEICGAVVSVRRVFFRIGLWIKTSNNDEIIQSLGKQLKQLLAIPPNISIEFSPHEEVGPGEEPNRIVI
ncbi:translation initiation factor eIF 4e-like domain-containing protein [Chlamydoabsidia padenii]|nr:translation initiation factor eIF 4e-like domain-containing protein [Chlamydoabsidia padenii]